MKKKTIYLLFILSLLFLGLGYSIANDTENDYEDNEETTGRGTNYAGPLHVYVNGRMYYNNDALVSLPDNCKRYGTITICSDLEGLEKDLVSTYNYENSVVWIGDEYPAAVYVERIDEMDNSIVYDAYVEEGFYFIDFINVDGDIYISCADLMNCIEVDWPEDISFVTDITDVEGITYEYDPLLEHYELLGEIKEGVTYGMPTEDMTYGAQGISTQGKVFRHKEEGYIVVGYEFKQTEVKGDKYILNQP